MRTIDQLFINSTQAASRMNEWAQARKAFFFLTDFEAGQCLVETTDSLPVGELQFEFPDISHRGKQKQTEMPEEIRWVMHPESFETYRRSFDIVRRNILAGNSFLTNLTCLTPIETNLSLLQIFEHARARYKLWIKDKFVVASPETFVRIHNGYIYAYPMKGTIDASLPDVDKKLLNDPKETAEHATITDLIRNDLSRFSQEVTVTRFRYLDKLRTHRGALWQMSSEIRGRLPDNYRELLGTLLFGMLPAGSISGAPKKKTIEIIREAENYRRGFYTGVMGYFDGTNLDSAVMIRFIEQGTDGTLAFKSGGGITFQSDARSEYEEMKQKVYVPIY